MALGRPNAILSFGDPKPHVEMEPVCLVRRLKKIHSQLYFNQLDAMIEDSESNRIVISSR
jgi:hypothetical protein